MGHAYRTPAGQSQDNLSTSFLYMGQLKARAVSWDPSQRRGMFCSAQSPLCTPAPFLLHSSVPPSTGSHSSLQHIHLFLPPPPVGWKCSTSPHLCPHLHPLQLAWPHSLPSTAVWRSRCLAEDFLDLDQFLRTVRLSPSLPHSANRRQTPDAGC